MTLRPLEEIAADWSEYANSASLPGVRAARSRLLADIPALLAGFKDRDSRLAAIRDAHPCFADCTIESGECSICSVLDCRWAEPLHYHHDGCPAEYTVERERDDARRDLARVTAERDDDREENIRLMGHIGTALDELGEPQDDWSQSMVEVVEQLRGAMEPYPNGPPSSTLARVTAERDRLRVLLHRYLSFVVEEEMACSKERDALVADAERLLKEDGDGK